jgi:hypothetical protein
MDGTCALWVLDYYNSVTSHYRQLPKSVMCTHVHICVLGWAGGFGYVHRNSLLEQTTSCGGNKPLMQVYWVGGRLIAQIRSIWLSGSVSRGDYYTSFMRMA